MSINNPTQGAIEVAESMLKILSDEEDMLKRSISFTDAEKSNMRRELLGLTHDFHITKVWREVGRQTLAIHPGIANEISLSSSAKIMPEVIFTIPYINPMVVYPEPLSFPSWNDSEELRLLGFICYGLTDKAEIINTHDPEIERFGFMLIMEVLVDGKIVDIEISRLSLSVSSDPVTIEEYAEEILERFQFYKRSSNIDTVRNAMRKVIKTVTGTLFYLCSTTLDAEIVPKSATRQMKPFAARKSVQLIRIGWNVGPALTNVRKEWTKNESGIYSHAQGPQHRRCHFKTCWTGKGRTVPKTVFVAPYITHRELWDMSEVKTVHSVPKQKVANRK